RMTRETGRRRQRRFGETGGGEEDSVGSFVTRCWAKTRRVSIHGNRSQTEKTPAVLRGRFGIANRDAFEAVADRFDGFGRVDGSPVCQIENVRTEEMTSEQIRQDEGSVAD